MFDTLNTKKPHYENGFFSVGTGREVVVILGSCRVLQYLNYFQYLNTENRFTLVLIEVVNFSFDEQDNQVDGREFTKRFENNAALLGMLARCGVFIHEHTVSYGLFNTDRAQEKNIYQFGMAPEIDISIPNFNDIWMLFQEQVNFDVRIRELARCDVDGIGRLRDDLIETVRDTGIKRLTHFLDICRLTSLPEMADIVDLTWRDTRYWWTGNHVANIFTATVFRLMNKKFLHLDVSAEVQAQIDALDMYSTPCSPITRYDREAFGITWPQATEELKIP